MTKGLFLERLRSSLSGKVSAGVVEENVAYYEDYINTQVRLGNSEEAVLNSLGDPRLLAKTIVTTNGGNAYDNADYREVDENGEVRTRHKEWMRMENMPRWLWTLLGGLLIVAVIWLVGTIVSFFLPFVIPIMVIWFVYKLFRDWLG